ncbi:MAG: HAMP domain-containing histidine kinase [Ignavibacteriae bacterium]|nr:HAMP domain-containing histidine kinase [Ignavibacteriota bacterium]
MLDMQGAGIRVVGKEFLLVPLLWTPLYFYFGYLMVRGDATLEQWTRVTVRVFGLHAAWFGVVSADPARYGILATLWFMAGIVGFSGSITRLQLFGLWILFAAGFSVGTMLFGTPDYAESAVILISAGFFPGVFLQLSEYVRKLSSKSRELLVAARERNFQMRQAQAQIEEQSRFLEQKNREISATLDALQSTQARLIHQEKLASLGQLTAGIAHEIRNPLNFIMNFSTVSLDLVAEIRHNDTERREDLLVDLEENLERIVDYGRRADAIVNNMMKHSRSEGASSQACDLNAITVDAVHLCLSALRAKEVSRLPQVIAYLDPTLAPVFCVPQDLSRLVINLVQNALYAMQIEAEDPYSFTVPAPVDPILRIRTGMKDGVAVMSIRDNGVGIPEEVRSRIFQPFFTTKPAGKGAGLGLSMSHDILAAHGGTIEVDSVPKEWTEFVVRLPIVAEGDSPMQTA